MSLRHAPITARLCCLIRILQQFLVNWVSSSLLYSHGNRADVAGLKIPPGDAGSKALRLAAVGFFWPEMLAEGIRVSGEAACAERVHVICKRRVDGPPAFSAERRVGSDMLRVLLLRNKE